VFAAVTKVAQSVLYFLRVTAVLIVLALLLGGSQSRADWPEHPITIIVPFPPSGATDLISRLLAVELAQRFGEKVGVENLAGDVGNIGLRAAALARPDGYTLLVTTNAALINLMINPKLSATAYDTPRDFAPIAYLGSTPNVIVTASPLASAASLSSSRRRRQTPANYLAPPRASAALRAWRWTFCGCERGSILHTFLLMDRTLQ
jgi:tripartite-type tricarboxylate transporter receptor subunit TctC